MRYIVTLNGKEYAVEVANGQAQIVDAAKPAAAPAPKAAPAPAPKAAPAPAPAPAAPAAAGKTVIEAPLPGNVFKVLVKAGDKVTSGQAVIVLEAMKMENEVFSPCDGVVASVNVTEDGTVNTGDVMLTIN